MFLSVVGGVEGEGGHMESRMLNQPPVILGPDNLRPGGGILARYTDSGQHYTMRPYLSGADRGRVYHRFQWR